VVSSLPKPNDSLTTVPQRCSGAYALMDSLKRHGVKHIFGYPGGAILPIYDELYRFEERGELQHILVRHEQAAAHAADAYARATGKVGVCFGTSGPGATNLVTGIANAHMDSIPMVIITGQVSRAAIGSDAFQETDIYGITLPIVKHSYVARNAREVARIVAEAFHIASTGRPGPVLVDIPKDVGLEQCDYIPVEPGDVKLSGYRPTVKGNRRQIEAALHLLETAEKPLLYVGGGAIAANAHAQIAEFAERFQLPVTTTLMGIGAFDEHHPLSVGMLGMHGTAYANFAVTGCDLLIAVGARFDDRVTGKLDEFASKAKVIHVDIDPAEVGKNRAPDVPIVGDVRVVLEQILQKAREFDYPTNSDRTQAWLAQIDRWRQDYPLQVPRPEGRLSPQEVIVEVGRQAPHAYYTTDVGQHQMWAAQFLKNGPRRWISSAQFNIHAKTIIINNGWQGMVRQWQEAFYGERYSNSNMEVGMPDVELLAQAYGIKGITIRHREELAAKIAEMLAHDGPVLVNAIVTKDENCYPMVAPGQSNARMIGLPKIVTRSCEMLNCPSCGAVNSVNNKFCPECGAKL